jgi:hypothetical protein
MFEAQNLLAGFNWQYRENKDDRSAEASQIAFLFHQLHE